MKKRILALALVLVFILSACGKNNETNLTSSEKVEVVETITSSETKTETTSSKEKKQAKKAKAKEVRAVWFSYIDLYYAGKTYEEFKTDIDKKFDNVKSIGCNRVICHIRANSDAAYNSKIFPFSEKYSGVEGKSAGYDPLEYMVKAAHKRGLTIEGWINPYRVATKTTNINDLSDKNPAKIWLTDNKKSNDNNVLFTKDGIFYNPASREVRRLIVDGVKEVLENYNVDGIQFDDYFYPTTDKNFDKVSYQQYKKSTPTALPLDEWRRTNINILIAEVYKTVHKFEGKTFGISPAAAISGDKSDRNYTHLYADIYTWMEDEGYIDYIAPQLYFGYEYPLEGYQFDKILSSWVKAKKHKNLKLYIGLANYKIGTEDAGSKEWIIRKDIISKQIKDIRSTKADGFMLYSYSAVFSDEPRNKQETNAIKNLLR